MWEVQPKGQPYRILRSGIPLLLKDFSDFIPQSM